MVPTICIADFPLAGTTVDTVNRWMYVRQQQRPQNIAKVKPWIFASEEMQSQSVSETLPTSRENYPWELKNTNTVRNRSTSHKKFQLVEPYRKFHPKRKDLLNIVIRTISLVQRNHILQKRLNALRAETRRLSSTLNNPKNRCQERRLQASHSEIGNVLPLTEQDVSTSSSLSNSDSIDENSLLAHAYIYNNNDNCNRIDDDCSSDKNSEDLNRKKY